MVLILQNTDTELQILAPAGSSEQLLAAVNNGCDAVYLGLDGFNARMKAPNFTADNLSQYVDYCHLFGVKVFVAINTSIKNDEFARAVELLKSAYLCNADGVIVTDLALMLIAGNLPKPFEVVASTQLNVHDKYGAEFVKWCGATTVVCARECSIEQIKEIASTGIGVECFLHGAMCVCQSGQCLFSSMVGGNSGNRGLCAQPCRKYYTVDDNCVSTSGHLLSARDMCSLYTLGDLVDAGATTFKIEGRNRRAEYAGIASRVYRRAFEGTATGNDRRDLAEMFNRGMSYNKYLSGDNSDIVYPVTQNHTGIEVGEVKNGGVLAKVRLRKGDGLKVYDGVNEVCGGIVLEDWTEKCGIVRAKFSGKVCDGMRVHRTTSVKLCGEALSAKRKLNANIAFIAKAGRKPTITAQCNGVTVVVDGDFVVQQAQNQPTSHDEIVAQLRKSGETHYTICDIGIETDNIFVAKSQINALRRQVLDELSQKLIENYNNRFANRAVTDLSLSALLFRIKECDGRAGECPTTDLPPCCAVICYDEVQLAQASKQTGCIIFKPDVIDGNSLSVASKYNAFVDLPSFANLQNIEDSLVKHKVGLVCNNVGQVEFARKCNLKYIVGGGLNLYNDYNVGLLKDAVTFVYSRELTLKEIAAFDNKNGLTFVDGKVPLMQLCHCPYKVAYDCDCCNCQSHRKLIYKDEPGNRFEIVRRRVGSQCLFELLNGNKLSVVSKLKNAGRYLIDYGAEVLNHYIKLNNSIVDDYAEKKPFTKGKLYDKIN